MFARVGLIALPVVAEEASMMLALEARAGTAHSIAEESAKYMDQSMATKSSSTTSTEFALPGWEGTVMCGGDDDLADQVLFEYRGGITDGKGCPITTPPIGNGSGPLITTPPIGNGSGPLLLEDSKGAVSDDCIPVIEPLFPTTGTLLGDPGKQRYGSGWDSWNVDGSVPLPPMFNNVNPQTNTSYELFGLFYVPTAGRTCTEFCGEFGATCIGGVDDAHWQHPALTDYLGEEQLCTFLPASSDRTTEASGGKSDPDSCEARWDTQICGCAMDETPPPPP